MVYKLSLIEPFLAPTTSNERVELPVFIYLSIIIIPFTDLFIFVVVFLLAYFVR